MKCEEARRLLSDFVEQYLAERRADLLREHLAKCEGCQTELAELERTLKLVRGLPRREPVLDLWQEFVPRFVEVRAEMKLGPVGRVKLHLSRFWATLVEGATMFVTVVSYNLGRRFQRYGVEDAD